MSSWRFVGQHLIHVWVASVKGFPAAADLSSPFWAADSQTEPRGGGTKQRSVVVRRCSAGECLRLVSNLSFFKDIVPPQAASFENNNYTGSSSSVEHSRPTNLKYISTPCG